MTLLAWTMLLGGALVAGVFLLALLILPRGREWMAVVGMVAGAAVSVVGLREVALISNRVDSQIAATFLALASLLAGYALASGLLPMLARRPKAVKLPQPGPSDAYAVVLLGCHEPPKYDPVALANELKSYEDSGVTVAPDSAKPLVFAAEKARYRAVGGSPGESLAEALANRLEDDLAQDGGFGKVYVASCRLEGSFERAVADAGKDGRKIVVAVLAVAEDRFLDRAKSAVEALRPRDKGLEILYTMPLWASTELAEWLSARILDAAAGHELGHVGVVLVGQGQPNEMGGGQADEQETMLQQRVRALLQDAGLEEQKTRLAWLEWEEPDVTESVRHLSALGAKWIVVSPVSMPAESVSSMLDIKQSIQMAAVPSDAEVVVLPAWGDSPEVAKILADAVRQAVREA